MGSFARTDSSKTPVERIRDTMNDVGSTILLTTLTSSVAFGLGAVSSIPAVQYLVMCKTIQKSLSSLGKAQDDSQYCSFS